MLAASYSKGDVSLFTLTPPSLRKQVCNGRRSSNISITCSAILPCSCSVSSPTQHGGSLSLLAISPLVGCGWAVHCVSLRASAVLECVICCMFGALVRWCLFSVCGFPSGDRCVFPVCAGHVEGSRHGGMGHCFRLPHPQSAVFR